MIDEMILYKQGCFKEIFEHFENRISQTRNIKKTNSPLFQ